MIPSLLQIPSAVSDSKLHSVLPNNGKGDFQFDRSTGATRINREGLIEEVGYFSSELVQNGNFSELGSELVTNGNFDTDSDWTKQNGSTISNSEATVISGNDNIGNGRVNHSLYQDNVFEVGKSYLVTFNAKQTVGSGLFQVGQGTAVSSNIAATSSFVTYTWNFTAISNTYETSLVFGGRTSGDEFKVDNVSVKEVDPNDRWTLGSAWNITDKANFDYSATSGLFTSRIYQGGLDLKSGKKYKLTFNVTTTGSTAFWIGNSAGSVNYYGGTYTAFTTGYYCVQFDMPSDQTTLTFFNNNSDATLDNISLVEVQGDRPRLSYDITNGVVEDKPHLLLEPSATNLITDYLATSWDEFNGASITANNSTSPDGTSNATLITFGGTSNELIQKSSITILSGSTYSISGYFKLKSGTLSNSNNDFKGLDGLGGGGVGTSTFNNLNNTWQRLSFSVTSSTTSGRIQIKCEDNAEILVYGLQLELGNFSTSLIPTAGTTITRSGETCNNSKPSVNSTEGVFYAEIAALADDLTNRTIAINDGTTSNTVRIQYLTISNAIWATVTNIGAGGNQAILQYTSLDITNNTKVALQYKANDFSLFVNGIKVATDSSGATFSANTLNTLQFDRGNGAEDFYGKVKGLAVYNEALSESQLMQLTGVTASSIYNNFVTRTASFTVEALNEVKKVIDNL